jgi:hypothetical protein
MISCEKAAVICSKSQYREAGFKERLQFWLHRLICKPCASFSRKNQELTHLCEKAGLKRLSAQEKSNIKSHLKSWTDENPNP